MSSFSNILLSFLLLFSSFFSNAEAAATNTDSHQAVRVQALQALHHREGCSSKEYEGSGLKIIDRHGPCSPFGGPKASPLQILQQDQARVNWLQSRRNVASSRLLAEDATLPSRLGSSFGSALFIVTVGFGTPKKDMAVAFDTGSSLTWIQCQPCAGSCYQQQDPIFNPAESSTYLNVSCNSYFCTKVSLSTNCSSSTCIYRETYGDGSTTAGSLARDTLTLTPSDVFPSFRFGCGQQSKGLFRRTAGLLALGRRGISLVYQTAGKFRQVFSYCLPSTSSSMGYLKFGAEAIPSGARFTPLLTNPDNPTFYAVNMVGITVGGKALPIPLSTFESPGTIIDSGTVVTRLPPSAYAALRSAFRQAMSKYTLVESPVPLFDTCYDFRRLQNISVPKIALRFEGDADLDVAFSGIIYEVNETVGCLAFAGNENESALGIIGNLQQRTVEVVYDAAGERLGFSPGGCGSSEIEGPIPTVRNNFLIILE